ncbi:PREDICTED: uncharacterized protein LOC108553642 [Eufriesea mexicana]|uniref:uncharacterized protein LOC108553642 n=1 Tax=Eufriesea mexicana TaxID=516756 RepID=UPI00083BE01F|nr:PREDICTED: uncharacterized protein LOC108553642 [Eufriesea mexicana]
MQSQCLTSFFSNLLNKSPRSLWKIKRCQFHATSVACRKKKKGEQKGLKIIKPGNGANLPQPILEPSCKNAIVIGGSEGFGFAAADHLLCKGARAVAIADDDPVQGQIAVKKLCDSYGKNSAYYVPYDLRSDCIVEIGLKEALCKLSVIHIIFNDLDKERLPEKDPSTTARMIRASLSLLGRNHGGPGGIIVSCASIFGFMGWPENPFPVYCNKEPVIEVTQDLAQERSARETGVRLVALCPTNKNFPNLGLSLYPEPTSNKRTNETPICIPESKSHIGTALSYVLAWAETGSTWLVEPPSSVYRVPRQIHFPRKSGEQVDPRIYEHEPCSVRLGPPCVKVTKKCMPTWRQMCRSKKMKEDKSSPKRK